MFWIIHRYFVWKAKLKGIWEILKSKGFVSISVHNKGIATVKTPDMNCSFVQEIHNVIKKRLGIN